MGGLNVKNTMVERVLQIIAPHPCSGCGKVGTILCEDCKYDIINESFSACVLCGAYSTYGICISHNSSITRAFTVSARTGSLETLINKFKFENAKAAAKPLAELFDFSLPLFSSNLIVTTIPTVLGHIRTRGYDHIGLVAHHLATLRDINLRPLLARRTKITQHTAGRATRKVQAEDTFELLNGIDLNGQTVLILDDVITTGSTLQAAAKILTQAGAQVWVATLAYQPLD